MDFLRTLSVLWRNMFSSPLFLLEILIFLLFLLLTFARKCMNVSIFPCLARNIRNPQNSWILCYCWKPDFITFFCYKLVRKNFKWCGKNRNLWNSSSTIENWFQNFPEVFFALMKNFLINLYLSFRKRRSYWQTKGTLESTFLRHFGW